MTSRAPKKKRMGRPKKTIHRERAARALAMTLLCPETEAARRAGVTRETLRRWREALADDPILVRMYEAEAAKIDQRWRSELQDVAAQAASDLRALQAMSTALVIDLLEHPERHGEPAKDGSVRLPSTVERLRLASQVQGDVRATLEKTAELLTHYAAIVAEPEPDVPHRETSAHRPPEAGGEAREDGTPAIH